MAPPPFVRATVRAMAGYAPGEQPGAGERVVKLNTNENPFPPSPKVLDAIREVDGETLRRYPEPMADAFRAAAAKLLDVSADMVLCGNGSDDLLTIATRTFVPPGDAVATPVPTYSLYPVLAQLADARHAAVPWRDGWRLPTDALLAADAAAVFFANPNSPSGTVVDPDDVAALAEKSGRLVLVDEAYADFWGRSCVGLVATHENVVVLRTLSKGYSLAGLRFGYAVAQPHVVAEMAKVKDSYNCDAISIAAAVAAIGDQAYARRGWECVRDERQRVSAELARLGFDVLPSESNFVLATVPDGDGRAMYEGLKRQGILVRHFDKPGLADKVRVTIGTAQENDAMLGGVKALLQKSAAA